MMAERGFRVLLKSLSVDIYRVSDIFPILRNRVCQVCLCLFNTFQFY